jgi:hypothetical protein
MNSSIAWVKKMTPGNTGIYFETIYSHIIKRIEKEKEYARIIVRFW